MSDDDHLLRELGAANPVPADRVHGLAESPQALDLMRRLSHTPRRPRRPRLIAWIAVPAAFLVAAFVTLVSISRTEVASAQEALQRAALTAEQAPSAPEAGRYRYSKVLRARPLTEVADGDEWTVLLLSVDEAWVAPNGSGRVRSVAQEPTFLGERDRLTWEAAGSPEFATGVSDHSFPPGVLDYEDLTGLPSDPERLFAALRSQVSSEDNPQTIGVFLRIGELLSRADSSPELRAGLYRAASELPGIKLLGSIRDRAGRSGVGVAITSKHTGTRIQSVMVFDAATSALLAQEEILLERAAWIDAPPGSVISYTVYLATGRVASTRVQPAG